MRKIGFKRNSAKMFDCPLDPNIFVQFFWVRWTVTMPKISNGAKALLMPTHNDTAKKKVLPKSLGGLNRHFGDKINHSLVAPLLHYAVYNCSIKILYIIM